MSRWYESAAFYHIYPLGLCGAPASNPMEGITHALPRLNEWIDHICAMGMQGLYIGPLFESSAHGYDTIDYRRIDRRLGDNEDFRALVKCAHGKGIHVVVDGVFNHTGREFFAFRDIREHREGSPYRWWYRGINFGWDSAWHDGFSYESWRNCGDLAVLDLKNREVKDYLFDTVRYWIREFDIDGIRLDCADCLDFDFMKELRWICDQEKPDFWLMGEVIHGDYARWANDQMLHSTTNYELNKGLWSGHNDHNYFEIAHTIRRQFDENGGIYRGRVLYSFADNHDVSRLPDKLKDQAHLFNIYTLLYTLPGLPSVYYGSEWGIRGRKEDGDAALRPALDLEQLRRNPPVPGLYEHICFLGETRRRYPVLAAGAYRELLLTSRQYVFARADGREMIITALNNDPQPAQVWIRPGHGCAAALDLASNETVKPEYDQLNITIPGNGSRMFYIAGN